MCVSLSPSKSANKKQEAYLLFQLSCLHAHIAKPSQLIGLEILIDMQINRSSRAAMCGISHFYWVPWSFNFLFYKYKYSNHAYLRYYKKTTTFYSIKKTSNPILRTLFNLNMEGMHLSLILQLLFMRCVNTEQHLILKGVEWWCLSGVCVE